MTSSLMIGTQVTRRPLAIPAEASIQPAWQIAATRLPWSCTLRTRFTIAGVRRKFSGANPPGMTIASSCSASTSPIARSALTG